MDAETLRRYYTSRTNVLKTLRLRGYIIHVDVDMTRVEFDDKYRSESIEGMKKDMLNNVVFADGGVPIIAVWIVENKLGVNVRDVNDKLVRLDVKRAIVVADNGVTPTAKETLRILRTTKKIFIDVWTIYESMVFVPEHVLVPAHRICTTREKKSLYEAYGLKLGEQKIPLITHDEIMVRYLGASKGQLIEIVRPSETDPSKKMLTYRLVV